MSLNHLLSSPKAHLAQNDLYLDELAKMLKSVSPDGRVVLLRNLADELEKKNKRYWD
jgi:hypothetical protein